MKVEYGTEEWVTHILITLSKSAKRSRQRNSLDQETNQHFMQALSTRKEKKTMFKSKEYSMTRPLKIVHIDILGPNTKKGLKGEK